MILLLFVIIEEILNYYEDIFFWHKIGGNSKRLSNFNYLITVTHTNTNFLYNFSLISGPVGNLDFIDQFQFQKV